jgi:hypothetical protein
MSEASETAAILMKMKLSLDEVQDSQATHAMQASKAMSEAATNAIAILLKMKNQRLSLDEAQDSQATQGPLWVE